MSTTTNALRPVLVLIRGLPGSGKSYLAAALADALGTGTVVLLDPDATDYDSAAYKDLSRELSGQGVDTKFHPYRFLRAQAYAGITAGQVVIWNQAFTNLDGFQKTVANLQQYAADQGLELPVLVVEVNIDPATARQRVVGREQNGGHGVSEEEFARFLRDYRSFADEGYQTVAIDGAQDVTQSVSTVVAAISALTA